MFSKSSRFFSFFVALLLLFGVTACGGGEEPANFGGEGEGLEQGIGEEEGLGGEGLEEEGLGEEEEEGLGEED